MTKSTNYYHSYSFIHKRIQTIVFQTRFTFLLHYCLKHYGLCPIVQMNVIA